MLPVWNAVTHHVVYRRTHRLGKSTVVQWRGISIVSDRLLVHDEVDFVCCHTNLRSKCDELKDELGYVSIMWILAHTNNLNNNKRNCIKTKLGPIIASYSAHVSESSKH